MPDVVRHRGRRRSSRWRRSALPCVESVRRDPSPSALGLPRPLVHPCWYDRKIERRCAVATLAASTKPTTRKRHQDSKPSAADRTRHRLARPDDADMMTSARRSGGSGSAGMIACTRTRQPTSRAFRWYWTRDCAESKGAGDPGSSKAFGSGKSIVHESTCCWAKQSGLRSTPSG